MSALQEALARIRGLVAEAEDYASTPQTQIFDVLRAQLDLLLEPGALKEANSDEQRRQRLERKVEELDRERARWAKRATEARVDAVRMTAEVAKMQRTLKAQRGGALVRAARRVEQYAEVFRKRMR